MGSAGKSTRYSTRKTLNIEPIEVYSDPETDLYGYATYDFEYTDRNTLQQKEAAAALVPLLQKKNLRRDRENPDILIFLEFYSDRRDQYVPPIATDGATETGGEPGNTSKAKPQATTPAPNTSPGSPSPCSMPKRPASAAKPRP